MDDIITWCIARAEKLRTLIDDIERIKKNSSNSVKKKRDMKSLQRVTTLHPDHKSAVEASKLEEEDPDTAFVIKTLNEIFGG